MRLTQPGEVAGRVPLWLKPGTTVEPGLFIYKSSKTHLKSG